MDQINLSMLNLFLPVFIFILVWVIVYAFLQKKEFISKENSINSLIAFIAAVLVVASANTTSFLTNLLPAFIFIMITLVFFLAIFSFIGWKTKSIEEGMEGNKIIIWTLIVIGFLIVAYSAGQVYGQDLLEITEPDAKETLKEQITSADQTTSSGDGTNYQSNLGEVLFNPKVLGFLFILIIATLVMFMLPVK